jgi:hypothetical protein
MELISPVTPQNRLRVLRSSLADRPGLTFRQDNPRACFRRESLYRRDSCVLRPLPHPSFPCLKPSLSVVFYAASCWAKPGKAKITISYENREHKITKPYRYKYYLTALGLSVPVLAAGLPACQHAPTPLGPAARTTSPGSVTFRDAKDADLVELDVVHVQSAAPPQAAPPDFL